MRDEDVQDVFRLTCQPQSLDGPPISTAVNVSMSEEDVSSVLSSISDCGSAPELRAASLIDHLPDMVIPNLDAFTALSAADLLSRHLLTRHRTLLSLGCYILLSGSAAHLGVNIAMRVGRLCTF